MSSAETIEKAISIALDNGWVQNLVWVHGNAKNKNEVFKRRIEIDNERIYYTYDEYVSVPELIYDQNFAKALWNDNWIGPTRISPNQSEDKDTVEYDKPPANPFGQPISVSVSELKTIIKNSGGSFERNPQPAWRYHLQQMVVADDPIAYLRDNMPQ